MKQRIKNSELHFAILATDVALLTVRDGNLLIRMIPVDMPPHFPSSKGLPGGLIHPTETAEQTAIRMITTKGGVTSVAPYLEQLYTFSDIDRDPRGRVVSVAYLALVPWNELSTDEQTDTETSWWKHIPTKDVLAYDHTHIVKVALTRLKSRVRYTTIVSKLMPNEFTLTELERVYESILHTDLDKRNFRKKILKLDILTALKKKRTGGAHRPAALYSFTSSNVHEIEVL